MTNRLSLQINNKTFELFNERKLYNQRRKLAVKETLVLDNTKKLDAINLGQIVQNKTKHNR